MTAENTHDARWDAHSERQLAAAKGAAISVTVLNSASWLALLSQVSNLVDYDPGRAILAWAFGALLGTATWLFIYRSTLLQWEHDKDRDNRTKANALNTNIRLGVGAALASLICFGVGAVTLACLFI